jgi:Lon protease-like protein
VPPIDLPDVIPIFPLPGTVLLPAEIMPLHIFEPRYRDMVRDALSGHKIIGMVQPMPGHEDEIAGAPPVRPVGCAGFIAKHLELPDGRFLIWLIGVDKFRINEELQTLTRYRQVRISRDSRQISGGSPGETDHLREWLLSSVPLVVGEEKVKVDALTDELTALDDQQLIAVSSQLLGLSGDRKQRLLEAREVGERYLLLHEAVEQVIRERPELLRFDPRQIN